MYLRFITQHIDEDGKTKRGFFQATEFIRYHYLTIAEDAESLETLYAWFKKNLDAPEWFKNPEGRLHEYQSLSWFKDSAKEHILKVQEIIEILEKYDLTVERITSKNPGRIVYEDKFQISAVPYQRKNVI